MALTNTITSNMYQPFAEKHDDYTPPMVEHLQTAGSSNTSGSVPVFSSATATDDMFCTALNVSIVDPTAASVAKIYLSKTQVGQIATGTADSRYFGFGPAGANVGTTTTATVSIVTSGGTATVYFYANGYRKK